MGLGRQSTPRQMRFEVALQLAQVGSPSNFRSVQCAQPIFDSKDLMTQAKRQPVTQKALARRLRDAQFRRLSDKRNSRGKRYDKTTLVNALTLGMFSNESGLRDVEDMTDSLTPRVRRLTGISTRISDTKLRDTLAELDYQELRVCLHHYVKAEGRRGNLSPTRLPFGVVAIDGKELGKQPHQDHKWLLKVEPSESEPFCRARVHRSWLISSDACVCVDERPIEGDTNEVGAIIDTLTELFDTYLHTNLVRMVTMDAGNCSLAAASLIEARGKLYCLRIESNQPVLHDFASKHLATLDERDVDVVDVEHKGGERIERRLFRVLLFGGLHTWSHARQLLLVERKVLNKKGRQISCGRRFFITNAEHKELDARQWLSIARCHWRCENEGHWTSDALFKEDTAGRWARWADGVFVVGLLRMLALSVLSVLRSMSRARHGGGKVKWERVIRLVQIALAGGDVKVAPVEG